MDKKEFLHKYVISRTSHKKNAETLLKEAIEAYEKIEKVCN